MAPSSLAPTAQALEVPGARLYYEVRGRGPLVVLVGRVRRGSGGVCGPAARPQRSVTAIASTSIR